MDDEKSTTDEDEDDVTTDCLTDEDCLKHGFPLVDKPSSKVPPSKSDMSLQCPKTPSPAGSAGDVFSIVASQGKQLSSDIESATSEATKEETSTRTMRTVKRRNSISGARPIAPMCPPPGMMMVPPGMMMVPPPSSPPTGCYYMAPMTQYPAPMSCMPAGFMPTPMVPTCAAAQGPSSSSGSLTSTASVLPEGLFAADATCMPPGEPDLSTVDASSMGPIGLSLKKSSSLLNLLNEPTRCSS